VRFRTRVCPHHCRPACRSRGVPPGAGTAATTFSFCLCCRPQEGGPCRAKSQPRSGNHWRIAMPRCGTIQSRLKMLSVLSVLAAACLSGTVLAQVSPLASKTELRNAFEPAAGSARAKTARKGREARATAQSGKSCGQYKYRDRKTGTCKDARDKKAGG